jgi:hypothetical protein
MVTAEGFRPAVVAASETAQQGAAVNKTRKEGRDERRKNTGRSAGDGDRFFRFSGGGNAAIFYD